MIRYKIILEYEGTPFVGWQFQTEGLSVQAVVEEAILKFSSEKVRIESAGRTDAGVHAQGQVAHFDLSKLLKPYKIREGLNFYLRPYPVVILSCEIVDMKFHARFSAIKRAYRYIILNRKAPPALEKKRVWWVPKPLDVETMNKAAQYFVGQHDFTSFRAAGCQASSPIRTLEYFKVKSASEDQVWFEVEARSFLHHQVRNMVGSLKWVGEGKWKAEDLLNALQKKTRAAAGPTAPPEGLYFLKAVYNFSEVKEIV
jgi:tRNA pseudouridine38-40 synthase